MTEAPQTELAALVSEASIEHIAEDIACAVMDPRPDVVAMRHSAMVRLGERLRNPLRRDIEFALAFRPSPLVDTEALREALEEAREAIASLPEDGLGMAQIAFGTTGVDVYPIRDELLAKIDAALAAHPKPEEG